MGTEGGGEDGWTPPAPESAGASEPFGQPPGPDSAWGGDTAPEVGGGGGVRRPDFEYRGRVTIDFSGPPLELPDAMESGSPEGEALTLDTTDFDAPPPRRAQRDGLITETGEEALELDLSGLEPAPAAPTAVADAWMVDREHRSSPPPTGLGARPPSGRSEPPMPHAQVARGRTNPAFPAAPSDAPHSITDSSEGDALGLVDRNRAAQQDLDLVSDMAERYALGDFTGALRAAELLLGISPDHVEATRYARSSRERLEQLFSSRLGPLTRVPRVAVPDHEIRWLGLDHRAGFLLSRVDGCHTIEEILDVSGMPRLEALKTLSELVGAGAVLLDD